MRTVEECVGDATAAFEELTAAPADPAAVARVMAALRALHDVEPPPAVGLGGWFHGGLSRREPGSRLLPPAQTGALAKDPGARTDRVYVTRNFGTAVFYAVPLLGVVHLVVPDGVPELDPQSPPEQQAFMAAGAVIERVVFEVMPP